MNETTSEPEPRKPLSLWFGLEFIVVAAALFGVGYAMAGKTTTRGWLATFAVAFELAGVLLVASPELRPKVERCVGWLRSAWHRFVPWLRRQFGRGGVHVKMGAGVTTEAAMGLKVLRGFEDPPPPEVSDSEKIEYLLRFAERSKELFNLLESQAREHVEGVRVELQRTASDLSAQTAQAVRRLAESELRMRLLGVVYIVVGLICSYLANVAQKKPEPQRGGAEPPQPSAPSPVSAAVRLDVLAVVHAHRHLTAVREVVGDDVVARGVTGPLPVATVAAGCVVRPWRDILPDEVASVAEHGGWLWVDDLRPHANLRDGLRVCLRDDLALRLRHGLRAVGRRA